MGNSTTTSKVVPLTSLSLIVDFFFFFSLVEIFLGVGELIEGFLIFDDFLVYAEVYFFPSTSPLSNMLTDLDGVGISIAPLDFNFL